jgi:hypothetical protein
VKPALLFVTVKPGAKQPGFQRENGAVVLRVRERAVEGAANAACIHAIARLLELAPSRIELVRGAHARRKTFAVGGFDQASLDLRLAGCLDGAEDGEDRNETS